MIQSTNKFSGAVGHLVSHIVSGECIQTHILSNSDNHLTNAQCFEQSMIIDYDS